ncbi:tol-pal system protein YbgF [Thioclava sp. SK-1]|uniref:tol-pal system protein YbgF n=1 Tax=Thioclava sp. SK-1 TaxID=1889770 RepID=UPI000824B49D|nr:tol-pal system protein YbgF [Thioclava sp. SK-1]OCX65890.1 tol-pal system protein YbgF [Thioclava sp. SK-1]
MRGVLKGAIFGITCLMGLPAAAQDAQTLADIRSQLGQLSAQVQSLRSELQSSGAAGLQAAGGSSALERMDTMEASLSRLTSQTEELQNRVNQVVADGTNRVGDLEFRLCEIEPGCDLSSIGQTAPLGGTPAAVVTAPAPNTTASPGADLAMNEQSDYDRAKAEFDNGNWQAAADQLDSFANAYPGGPLSDDALFLKGAALDKLGQTSAAARAWLAAFSTYPESDRAPDSLTALGAALGKLGQKNEACATLAQVTTRYGDASAATSARTQMTSLGCY